MKHFLLVFVFLLSLFGPLLAGSTGYNAIVLDPVAGETNSLVVNNSTGTAQLTITAAGAATFANTVAMQGAQTVTADMTFTGAGIDILANAAGENELGSDAAPFEKGWLQAVDVEGPVTLDGDLTIGTAGSDILVTDNITDYGTEAASGKAMYVKTFDADTSINTDGTLNVGTTSTLVGVASLQNKIVIDSGGTGTEAQIDFSGPASSTASARINLASNQMIISLASNPASGVSTAALTVTSSATSVPGRLSAGTVVALVASAESIAAAATFTPHKSFVLVTGATAITSITITPYPAGAILILNNSAGGDGTGPVVTDGNNLKMAGNFTLGPDDTLAFVSDGTNLYEIFRSAN